MSQTLRCVQLSQSCLESLQSGSISWDMVSPISWSWVGFLLKDSPSLSLLGASISFPQFHMLLQCYELQCTALA